MQSQSGDGDEAVGLEEPGEGEHEIELGEVVLKQFNPNECGHPFVFVAACEGRP